MPLSSLRASALVNWSYHTLLPAWRCRLYSLSAVKDWGILYVLRQHLSECTSCLILVPPLAMGIWGWGSPVSLLICISALAGFMGWVQSVDWTGPDWDSPSNYRLHKLKIYNMHTRTSTPPTPRPLPLYTAMLHKIQPYILYK